MAVRDREGRRYCSRVSEAGALYAVESAVRTRAERLENRMRGLVPGGRVPGRGPRMANVWVPGLVVEGVPANSLRERELRAKKRGVDGEQELLRVLELDASRPRVTQGCGGDGVQPEPREERARESRRSGPVGAVCPPSLKNIDCARPLSLARRPCTGHGRAPCRRHWAANGNRAGMEGALELREADEGGPSEPGARSEKRGAAAGHETD